MERRQHPRVRVSLEGDHQVIWWIAYIAIALASSLYMARQMLISMENAFPDLPLDTEDRVLSLVVGFLLGLFLPGVCVLLVWSYHLLVGKIGLLRTPNEIARQRAANDQAELRNLRRLAAKYDLPIVEEESK